MCRRQEPAQLSARWEQQEQVPEPGLEPQREPQKRAFQRRASRDSEQGSEASSPYRPAPRGQAPTISCMTQQSTQTARTRHIHRFSQSSQNFSSSFPFYLETIPCKQLTKFSMVSKLQGSKLPSIRRSQKRDTTLLVGRCQPAQKYIFFLCSASHKRYCLNRRPCKNLSILHLTALTDLF